MCKIAKKCKNWRLLCLLDLESYNHNFHILSVILSGRTPTFFKLLSVYGNLFDEPSTPQVYG